MRVLYAVHALPAAGLGGTELYTRRLAETLARGSSADDSSGDAVDGDDVANDIGSHEVAVATPRGHDTDLAGVSVYALPDVAEWTDPTGRESGLECGVVHEEVDRRFADVLDDFAPDVVHFQHLKFLSAGLPAVCRDRGVPSVLTLHDFWVACHREQLVQPGGVLCDGPDSVEKCAECYAGALEQSASSGDSADERGHDATDYADAVQRRSEHLVDAREAVDVLVSPSRFLRRQFCRFGTPPERIVHRRNGIDAAAFDDTGFDPDSALRFGYAGRITHLKGVHVLLAAFAAVDGDAELHVFGKFDPTSDPYHAELEGMASPGVTFHGRYGDATEPYEAVDVLVVPSVWYENSPLVVQEAFASGVPVVAGDIGGMAELVTDGEDGLTYETGNSADLADHLQRLTDSPGFVRRLREGVEPPKSTDEHARELLELYAACRDGRVPEVGNTV